MNFVRRKLAKANRCVNPCNKCDVHGDIIGEDSFNAFKNIINDLP